MMNFQVFAVRLSEADVTELDRIAQEKQVSRSAVIRWAIDDYLKSFYLPDCPTNSTIGLSNDQTSPANN
jgi:metal-responsive CopG/Arc/MetJ family transcriptional regulator